MKTTRHTSIPIFAWALLAANAGAQCTTEQLAGSNAPGALAYVSGGVVRALVPRPNGVFLGGVFQVFDASPVGNAVEVHNATGAIEDYGSGPGGRILDAIEMPNGDLVVGLQFPASSIRRWNGTSWQTIATGTWDSGTALEVLPNGDLVAAGNIITPGGPATIASWDGTTWHMLDDGTSIAGTVHDLVATSTGELLVAHDHTVSLWNGIAWQPLGAFNDDVFALALDDSGAALAGGDFQLGGNQALARWDGTSWQSIGTGFNGSIRAIAIDSSGTIHVGGSFNIAGTTTCRGIARWNRTSWEPLGYGVLPQDVRAIAFESNGDMIVGGSFATAGLLASGNVARWSPVSSTWSPLVTGIGPNDEVETLGIWRGDLIAGGRFSIAGSGYASRIARFDGTTWHRLGQGLNGAVRAVAEMPNGDLAVIGEFSMAGGQPASGHAHWDGTTWHPKPGPLGWTIAVMPNGDLIGTQGRWDGTTLHPMSMPFSTGKLAISPAGVLHAASNLASSSSIQRWDGATWQAVGTITTRVHDLAWTATGRLFCTTDHNLLEFVNNAWTAIATGPIPPRFLSPLPDGRLAGINLGTSGSGILDDVTFAPLTPPPCEVKAILWSDRDGLIWAGDDPSHQAYITRLVTDCLASSKIVGTGCSGSSGPNELTTVAQAWAGGVYRADATGLPPASLAIEVIGFSALATPLSTIEPSALPDCTLLVTPDILSAYVTTSAPLQVAFAIPESVNVGGLSILHQVVTFELNAQQVAGASATNALEITIGVFQ